MKIIYKASGRVRFDTLAPGQLFRDCDGNGLFVKIVPFQIPGLCRHAVTIEASGPDGTDPGTGTAWPANDLVWPVKALHVEM